MVIWLTNQGIKTTKKTSHIVYKHMKNLKAAWRQPTRRAGSDPTCRLILHRQCWAHMRSRSTRDRTWGPRSRQPPRATPLAGIKNRPSVHAVVERGEITLAVESPAAPVLIGHERVLDREITGRLPVEGNLKGYVDERGVLGRREASAGRAHR